MNTFNFEKGDLVKTKDPSKYYIKQIEPLNIFEIAEVKGEFVCLNGISEMLSFSELLPIPITKKDDDDRWIYYSWSIMATYTGQETSPKPIPNRGYSYYIDSFKEQPFGSSSLYDVIQEKGFKYVHEIQHFLRDNEQNDLMINECLF